MDTPDQPLDRALLYLRMAGHDTGPETRARLHRMLQVHAAENLAMSNGQLLARMTEWFPLPGPCRGRPLPPITRASIGYPRE